MADPKELTDRIAREENMADKKAFNSMTIDPLKRGLTAIKDKIIGTPAQNQAAADKRRAANAANPNTFNAKLDSAVGMGGYKKGGSVGSASKRADGCAKKGKTKGKMV